MIDRKVCQNLPQYLDIIDHLTPGGKLTSLLLAIPNLIYHTPYIIFIPLYAMCVYCAPFPLITG